MPTELLKDTWTVQDRVYPDKWWLKKYWHSTEGSHRDAIIRALERVGGGFGSLLEVGCNAGPNLRRIHGRWPSVQLAGLDVHRGAVEYGTAAAREEGWHWTGHVGDLRELDRLAPVDVVLSCYALAYLDPRDIDRALGAALACARKAVILCEPSVTIGQPERYIPPGPNNVAEYLYDYRMRLAALPGPHRASETPITPPHERLTQILTIRT